MRNKFALILLLILVINLDVTFSQDSILFYQNENLDVKLLRSINNNRTAFLDGVFRVSDKSLMPVLIAVPAGLFTYSRFNNNYYDENSAILTELSVISTTLTGFAIKNIFKRERPFAELSGLNIEKTDIPGDRYSFPSLHAANSFAFATSLTLRYPDKPVLITGVYLYALLVSYGRPYLGVHYPSDILTGAILGSGMAALVFSLRPYIINAKNNVFRESGKPDLNSSANLTTFAIGGLFASEAINYLLQKSKVKVLKNMNTVINNDDSYITMKFCLLL